MEKPFFSFVGEKCCNTTILDPQQFKTVGVGMTFQSFVGVTLIPFVGHTVSGSQQMKLLVLEVIMPILLQLFCCSYRFWLRKVLEALFSFCWSNNFSPRPTKLCSPKRCRYFLIQESSSNTLESSNKRVKSLHNSSNRSAVLLLGSQNL